MLAACSGDDSSASDTNASSSSSGTGESASSTSNGSATATATATTTASGTATESGTDSGTTTDDPTATTTTTADPTTGESTGDPTDTTGDPTDTTGDPTGGVDESGCEGACDKLVMCVPDYPLEECLAACDADFQDADGAECKAASAKANMCFGTLDCPQILNENYGECIPVFDAQDAACSGGMVPCEANLQMMGKGCRVTFTCENSQSGMQCNQQGCSCVEDGMQVGQCMNDGFCALDLDAAIDAANECCGWNF